MASKLTDYQLPKLVSVMNKKRRKSYNFIDKLVNKITRTDYPNNTQIMYYGNKVYLQSGTQDYMSVYIIDREGYSILLFSFDYLTMELNIEDYTDIRLRDKLANAFKEIYRTDLLNHLSITDELLENEIKEQREFITSLIKMGDEVDETTIKNEELKLSMLVKEKKDLYSTEYVNNPIQERYSLTKF